MIRVNVGNDEKAAFEEYCAAIGIAPSTHLKRLINKDAVRNELNTISKGVCEE